MNYNIGQFRKPLDYNFTIPIKENDEAGYTKTLISTIQYANGATLNFKNICLEMNGGYYLESTYCYYIKFKIKLRIDGEQFFFLKLQNDTFNETQIIDTFYTNIRKAADEEVMELIFNPNSSYDKVIFELQRDTRDLSINREADIEILEFSKVNNVIEELKVTYPGLTTLKKIGIQGPPGMLFCLDGEEIHVGRSGVYELYNKDISISYIGFIVNKALITQNGEDDFFIMDFKY